MESHGELIKPVLRQLITWTPPKEGITLLELFGGISTCLEVLLQLGMAIWKYFYVDIDPITKQVATLRMMELIAKFPQQFATTTWKANFTFLPFDIQLIQKKHMELLGPMDLIISSWEHSYDILSAGMLWKPKEARILKKIIDQPVNIR
jgi:hypothetical protein